MKRLVVILAGFGGLMAGAALADSHAKVITNPSKALGCPAHWAAPWKTGKNKPYTILGGPIKPAHPHTFAYRICNGGKIEDLIETQITVDPGARTFAINKKHRCMDVAGATAISLKSVDPQKGIYCALVNKR